LIHDINESINYYGNCAGFAATQLDVEDAPRIFIMNAPEEHGGRRCFANPEILTADGNSVIAEACMSIYPDKISVPISRPDHVIVKAQDSQGQIFTAEYRDFWAHCIQHELDHLDGILFIDRLSPLKRERVDKKIQKVLAERAHSA
jgi:peptide deformylase